VAAHIGSACPTPTVAVDASFANGCYGSPTIHAWAIGAPISAVYQNGSGAGACTSGGFGDEAYYATTGVMDPSTFPAIDAAPFGTSSLQVYYRATPDGVAIVPLGEGVLPNSEGQHFRDVGHGADCDAMQMQDGTWRCVPTPLAQLYAGTRFFADAACTQEIVDGGIFPHACPPPEPVVAIRPHTGSCADTPIDTIYSLGPAVAQGSFFTKDASGTTCKPTSPQADQRFYALAATIDPATLPPLTQRTE
jgi:hypothetical protein